MMPIWVKWPVYWTPYIFIICFLCFNDGWMLFILMVSSNSSDDSLANWSSSSPSFFILPRTEEHLDLQYMHCLPLLLYSVLLWLCLHRTSNFLKVIDSGDVVSIADTWLGIMLRALLLLRTVIQPETTEFFPLFVSSFLFSMASNINSANRLHSPAVASPNRNYSPRADMSSSQHLNNIFGAVRKQVS